MTITETVRTPVQRIGDAPKRREDQRFIIGAGRYLDDMTFDGLAHAVVLRSPHAHARIDRLDATAARKLAGVVAILTAVEAQADGLHPLMPGVIANTQTGEPFSFTPQPLFAEVAVRHVGEAIALIVAETRLQALDAAEAIEIDYAPLPAIVDPRDPAAEHCLDWQAGDPAAVDSAFAQAMHKVSIRLDNHRVVTNPIEPRGIVGTYDFETGRYIAYVSAQSLHATRDNAAKALGVAPDKVRFIAPDVGGGFGAKNFIYPEHALLPWAAKRVGRPVKWIATREEVFLADHQGRGHHAEATLALDEGGKFLALRIASTADLGAYLAGSSAGVQTFQYAHLPGTVYAIPAVHLSITGVFTNTAPIGVLRGPGYAEMVNIVERLVDEAARQCGLDRAEIRRRNLVAAAAMPMTNPLGNQVDSGAFPDTFDRALAAADIPGFAGRKGDSEAAGKLRGLGFAYHIKGTGGSPSENVDIRFGEDGVIQLLTGTQTIGQGHETTFPQILADRLGLPNEQIVLRYGDTDLTPIGGGHGSSRATYMGGTAIFRAAEMVIEKGTRIAADALEAAEADIVFADGCFTVAGTDRRIDLLEVAALARKAGAPLDSYYAWTREWMTYPNGTHVAEIEIDRDTGQVTLARYSAVDDYGVVVNPMIASGQAHGAIAQGVGQALLEQTVYDPSSGQNLAASFMDYAMPRADDLVAYRLGFNPTRCTTNPLGVKGCGEAGAIAGYPAVNNAIADALAPFGVTDWQGPATPSAIWRAMQRSKAA
ncbi:MAG TPA: xanthine dehydrogenase family protein molybdopterin-binding subunit [Stellaceae bacterium]|jgi:carbon-monoxide dehydrogenase large subunit